jgi:hypothetical protein
VPASSQPGIQPRAPQASAQAAAGASDLFADLSQPAPAPSAATEPAPYKNRVEALDDAVNYLDEGRDIAEVAAGFQGIGITQDEILRHAQQRGAASTQPTPQRLADPRTAPKMQYTAADRVAGVLVRGVQQARQVATVVKQQLGAIKDEEAAKQLADSMSITQSQEYAQPRDTQTAMAKFGEAEGFGDALMVVLRNPLKVTEGLAESVVASMPQAVATAGAGIAGSLTGVGGVPAMMATAGSASFATEYASAISEAVTQAGGDPTDAKQIMAAFQGVLNPQPQGEQPQGQPAAPEQPQMDPTMMQPPGMVQ